MSAVNHPGSGCRGPWVAVIPQRDITSAKSRLLLRPEARQAVVRAMFRDTVSAVQAASRVQAVVVVVDRIQDAAHVRSPGVVPLILPDTRGINDALREGGRRARELWPECRLAGLPADLPSLRSEDLDVALSVAGRHARTFVADRRREGTSLLTAAEGIDLDPQFGDPRVGRTWPPEQWRRWSPTSSPCGATWTISTTCRTPPWGKPVPPCVPSSAAWGTRSIRHRNARFSHITQ